MLKTSAAAAAILLIASPALAQTPAAQAAPAAQQAAAGAQAGPNPDPWEPLNRRLYALHQGLDRIIFRPLAMTYKHLLPRPLRNGVHNAIVNLGEPMVFANYVLQGRIPQAGRTVGRFVLNSTLGVGGFGDPAADIGLTHHDNDFGMTLGRWGVGPGPYLFIPLMGPTTVRDGIGTGVNIALDPLTWSRFDGRRTLQATETVAGGLDTRARFDPQLKQIESMATDTYATLRSLYLQNRQAEISGGQVNVQALPDFGDEQAAPAGQTAPGAAPQPSQAPTGPQPHAPPAAGEAAPPPASPGQPPPKTPETPHV